MSSPTRADKGHWAEELAQQYLIQQGLIPITQNYRCKFGEIDLILWEKAILVFVEVRYRQTQHYGGGIASINKQKQQRIVTTASLYLQQQPFHPQPTCRFDAIILSGNINTTPDIQWLKDAFRVG
ncbi:YraN family protein [Beggiatoa leptomitoformis]|uniref:UPF0102 protein BLE401_02875 n=1 Tax=Beggiatoa leptomitoformis TaxID=288004 RepID=A0A2N9YBA6_9GAMM|nr:YraN family protein [Beggiatoa leptomitoformis]ALG66897.1 YraN family protein [Beggiatoa leptomitoformis]AUI67741.1 YraN family protein [Beggiatoa leptomitoformis]